MSRKPKGGKNEFLAERLTDNSGLNLVVTTQGGKCTESQHENRVLYTCGLTQHMKNVHVFLQGVHSSIMEVPNKTYPSPKFGMFSKWIMEV